MFRTQSFVSADGKFKVLFSNECGGVFFFFHPAKQKPKKLNSLQFVSYLRTSYFIPVVPRNKQTFFFFSIGGRRPPFLAGRNFFNLTFTKNVAKSHDHAQVSKWDGLKY